MSPEKVILKNIRDVLEGLLTRGGDLNKAGKLAVLNNKVLETKMLQALPIQNSKTFFSSSMTMLFHT